MALYMQAYNKSSKHICEIERRSELELEIKFVKHIWEAHFNYVETHLVQFGCYYILLEMIVEKMNILKTVFLWYYSEEIYYQN